MSNMVGFGEPLRLEAGGELVVYSEAQRAAMAAIYEMQSQIPVPWVVMSAPAFEDGYCDGWVWSASYDLLWFDARVPEEFKARGYQRTADGIGFGMGWSDCGMARGLGVKGAELQALLRWRMELWRVWRGEVRQVDRKQVLLSLLPQFA